VRLIFLNQPVTVFYDRVRPKPARDGFEVEWPVYFVSRRSLKLSRKTEFGASGHCTISTGDVSKIAADRPLSKMRQCANDPDQASESLRNGRTIQAMQPLPAASFPNSVTAPDAAVASGAAQLRG
jgi:hypothetical protein